MGKTNSTVNDAQLKGRRTSLEKKSKEELINIVLRKDSTERKNNSKITDLTKEVENCKIREVKLLTKCKALDEQLDNASNLNRINIDAINSKEEVISSLKLDLSSSAKEIARLKYICNFRRKLILANALIITVMALVIIFC